MDSWFFHNDNTQNRCAKASDDHLTTKRLKLLEHLRDNPLPTPYDFALFSHVITKIKGMWFSINEDLLKA